MAQSDTITLPSCWACYLINGDSDGLDSDDLAAVNRHLIATEAEGWRVVSCDEDSVRFTWHYALYGGTAEGGAVMDYTILRHRENEPC